MCTMSIPSQRVRNSNLVDAGMQSQYSIVIMKFLLELVRVTISMTSFPQICTHAHGINIHYNIVQHEVTMQAAQQACAHILSKIEYERRLFIHQWKVETLCLLCAAGSLKLQLWSSWRWGWGRHWLRRHRTWLRGRHWLRRHWSCSRGRYWLRRHWVWGHSLGSCRSCGSKSCNHQG
jgi:hypothetical protein